MSDTPDLTQQIQNLAGSPSSVTSDGTTVSMPNIKDLIEADKYLSQKAVKKSPWKALRFGQIQFPGAVR